jgi:3-hydroxybutyryl-CoA dehydrogenase
MSGAVVEAASNNTQFHHEVENVFNLFNRKVKWVPDSPGFITARVVSMIINEAYLALGEGVSSRKDIDTAMKLGTNYPFGPFEWADKIGLTHVHQLLVELAQAHKRYQPATLLTQEALS